jgi:glycosyltransferase involved in cell wall biosynthesis
MGALAASKLAVTYLLEDTVLFGGVKVVLHQANLLHRRGHRVLILSKGERPAWFPLEADFERVDDFGAGLPPADVTVATYWTTLQPALALARGEVAHYCQGFEGCYTHNQAQHAEIEEAYRQPVPALVVAPHLAKLLRARFGRPARVVPQPLEPFWRPAPLRFWPRRKPRLLVASPFEIDWKGVPTALEAVRRLRADGLDFTLVRLSQWPQTDAERALLAADEFHTHLKPPEVAALVRGCDLVLAASWQQEGFGLPVLEALASGVPAVVSDIDCFRDFAGEGVTRVPFDQPAAFADAARELLMRPALWRARRRAGKTIARGYQEAVAAQGAEDALRWVAGGGWQDELAPAFQSGREAANITCSSGRNGAAAAPA